MQLLLVIENTNFVILYRMITAYILAVRNILMYIQTHTHTHICTLIHAFRIHSKASNILNRPNTSSLTCIRYTSTCLLKFNSSSDN